MKPQLPPGDIPASLDALAVFTGALDDRIAKLETAPPLISSAPAATVSADDFALLSFIVNKYFSSEVADYVTARKAAQAQNQQQAPAPTPPPPPPPAAQPATDTSAAPAPIVPPLVPPA